MACGQSIRLKRKWQHIYGYILSNQKKAGTAGLPCRFMPVSFGFVNSVPIIPADIIIDNNVIFPGSGRNEQTPAVIVTAGVAGRRGQGPAAAGAAEAAAIEVAERSPVSDFLNSTPDQHHASLPNTPARCRKHSSVCSRRGCPA